MAFNDLSLQLNELVIIRDLKESPFLNNYVMGLDSQRLNKIARSGNTYGGIFENWRIVPGRWKTHCLDSPAGFD